MGINFAEAQWIGFLITAIIYGINTVVYPVSLIILLSRRNWTRYKNKKMVAATSLLYLLATLHFWTATSSRYLATFANYDVYIQSPENLVANVVAAIADFVGDLVLMHRLWILWGRRTKVVIIPFTMSVFALISVSAGSCLWYTAASPFPINSADLILIVGFTLSAAVSLFVTVFIIGRIWWISSGVKRTTNGAAIIPKENFSSIRTAIEVSVESGLLVALSQTILVISFPLQSPLAPLVAFTLCQIYCFAPTMVIVRVGLMGPPKGATTAPATRNVISTIRFAHAEEDEIDEESRMQISAIESGTGSGSGTKGEDDDKPEMYNE